MSRSANICYRLQSVLGGVLLLLLVLPCSASLASPTGLEVPDFQIRFRVTGVDETLAAGQTFHLLSKLTESPINDADKGRLRKWATSRDGKWSEWGEFGKLQAEEALKLYPNSHHKKYPVVIPFRCQRENKPASGQVHFEGEIRWANGGIVPVKAELLGPNLSVLIWRDQEGEFHAGTMADYNRLFIWSRIGSGLPEADRPKRFLIADRFIGGSADLIEWQEATECLARQGFSALALSSMIPLKTARQVLMDHGIKKTAAAIYNPPGYVFDFNPRFLKDLQASQPTAESEVLSLKKWAEEKAAPYREAGFKSGQVAIFGVSDEPGWYYPNVFQSLEDDPAALSRFWKYLEGQGLRASDVGAENWSGVRPIGASQATDLPKRRLFYWTMRFFSADSARHFSEVTDAMSAAFHPGIANPVNWNFFSGRFYVPGPAANNPDKTSADAGMGGHDWLEFARMHGSNMLWTEDWFRDHLAFQWSFYAAKLAPAARRAGIEFGGYVVPGFEADRKYDTEYGLLQKILSVVGHGGKGLKFFVFGPEYYFPGNCYSEGAAQILPKIANANRLIARAEELLWPGRKPQAEIAILQPLSSQPWDPHGVADATNFRLNTRTVDYMAEAFDLYSALQQENIPAEFVAEEDLNSEGLKGYKVLYITEPNIPKECIPEIRRWVEAGGGVVTVSGALTRDRYNDELASWEEWSCLKEEPRDRLFISDALRLPKTGVVDGSWEVFGVRGALERVSGLVKAKFDDGSAAIVERRAGKGWIVHFAFLPGLSAYVGGGGEQLARDGKAFWSPFPPISRRWIAYPARLAGIQPPVRVSHSLVETPLLLSDQGAVVTLLNWNKDDIEKLKVSVKVPFKIKSAESATLGKLDFDAGDSTGGSFSLPLRGADIVTLRR